MDMSDRELLELAAKAAGMQGWKFTGSGMAKMIAPSQPETTGSIGSDWNPLTDDGDALRLAVGLRITVAHDAADEGNAHYAEWIDTEYDMEVSMAEHEAPELDALAATRRVIVMAAAEIGGRE